MVFASTFGIFATGRCWEQIRLAVAYPKLNVKICATHCGITVGEDGASHQALEDMAIMRSRLQAEGGHLTAADEGHVGALPHDPGLADDEGLALIRDHREVGAPHAHVGGTVVLCEGLGGCERLVCVGGAEDGHVGARPRSSRRSAPRGSSR